MKEIADELLRQINQYRSALLDLPATHFDYRPAPGKWSRKEEIGHLVDSAHSNIRRFVVSQYETDPLIIYRQNEWVAIAHYNDWDHTQLIGLWYLLNLQAVGILKNLSPGSAARTCLTPEQHTVEWLASDYIIHLRHHMDKVLQGKPVPAPEKN